MQVKAPLIWMSHISLQRNEESLCPQSMSSQGCSYALQFCLGISVLQRKCQIEGRPSLFGVGRPFLCAGFLCKERDGLSAGMNAQSAENILEVKTDRVFTHA